MRQPWVLTLPLVGASLVPSMGQETGGEANGVVRRGLQPRQAVQAISRQTTDYDVERLLEQNDTNKDGKLGEEDRRIPPVLARSFGALDVNSDGYLDQAELRASNYRPYGGKLFIEAFDTDADGELTKDEAIHPLLARAFERFDEDESGTLSQVEMDTIRGGISFGRSRQPAQGDSTAGNVGRSGDESRSVVEAMEADTNRDGKLSDVEAGKLVGELFDTLDTNKDGFASEEELQANARLLEVGRTFGGLFRRVDSNSDGLLTREEAHHAPGAAAIAARFDELDPDKSGDVSRREFLENFVRGVQGSQQRSGFGPRNDPAFKPDVKSPHYTHEDSPTVAIDEGHQNLHTKDGSYLPFAQVLGADGCNVVGHAGTFTRQSLKTIEVLVIANALHASTDGRQSESAFSEEEIEVLKDWVVNGGSLMVLADHRPYGEAAQKLGEAFGIEMSGGIVLDDDEERGLIVFDRESHRLANHPITEGATTGERITSIVTFTGQALRVPDSFTPLMSLAGGAELYSNSGSISTGDGTDVSGWHQGAVGEFGQGRVAFFGEAGMFTAQVAGLGFRKGMNAFGAEQNQRFLLNTVHWLTSD